MWTKIDDGFPDHPKIVKVGPLGLALQIRAFCYCGRFLTDGFLPAEVIQSLVIGLGDPAEHPAGRLDPAGPGWTAIMMKVGLWEKVEGGFLVHDYLEYNPSRAEVMDQREQWRQAAQLGGKSRSETALRGPGGRFLPAEQPADRLENETHEPAEQPADRLEKQPAAPPGGVHQVSVPVPVPLRRKRTPHTPQRGSNGDDPDFTAFWQTFPNKTGKGAARKAWAKLKPSPELVTMILAAITTQNTWATWQRDGGRYIPHPATWLNQERWTDERSGGYDSKRVNDPWQGQPEGEVTL